MPVGKWMNDRGLALKNGSIVQKPNKMENTMETAYRFEFEQPTPHFKMELLVASQPEIYNGIPIRITLSDKFTEAFGLHNKCYKFTPSHIAKYGGRIPSYNHCICDEEKMKRKISSTEAATKKQNVSAYRKRKEEKAAAAAAAPDPFAMRPEAPAASGAARAPAAAE